MSNRQLTAADGHVFDAYEAIPDGAIKGGIVVIQEIFGVNPHIREVVDGYAKDGYAAIAPALFDRVERGVELGYDEQKDFDKGLDIAFQKLKIEDALVDIQAVAQELDKHGKVGVVGYCFGGLLTWLSACRLNGISACSAYYGGGTVNHISESAKCPVIMHFGEKDEHIPMTEVEKIRSSLRAVDVYVYDADHGFNCDHRSSYDQTSAETAKTRTLDFFASNL
tara:strand:+ start:196 stop:864 length:669 start_codon:yes stop_codon:yes gene_type:complete